MARTHRIARGQPMPSRGGGASEQHLLRQLQHGDGLIAAHRREILEKFIEGITGFEIIEQRLHRHTSADEDGRAAENLGIAMDR